VGGVGAERGASAVSSEGGRAGLGASGMDIMGFGLSE